MHRSTTCTGPTSSPGNCRPTLAQGGRTLEGIERLIQLAIALIVGTGVTFAGVYAATAAVHGAAAWATGVQALAMPLAMLASRSGAFDTPVAFWLLVAGGFLLWVAIGYLAAAQLLRRRSGD